MQFRLRTLLTWAREHWLVWSIAGLAAVAFTVTTAWDRGRLLNEFSSDGLSQQSEFGWPLPFVRGMVNIEQGEDTFFSILLIQDPEFDPLGVATDAALGVLLVLSAAYLGQQIRRFRPRFSLALLIGLLTFACIEAHHRWGGYRNRDESAAYVGQLALVVYSEKITWFFVLVACLVVPHVLGRLLGAYFRLPKGHPS